MEMELLMWSFNRLPMSWLQPKIWWKKALRNEKLFIYFARCSRYKCKKILNYDGTLKINAPRKKYGIKYLIMKAFNIIFDFFLVLNVFLL